MGSADDNWLLAFDNLSGLDNWLSDAFCRLATGSRFATKTLYTNRGDEVFDAKRSIILIGIPDLATRPDLADRALAIRLPKINDECRRSEQSFWSMFEEARPPILGAAFFRLLNCSTIYNLRLSTACRRERARHRKPRMENDDDADRPHHDGDDDNYIEMPLVVGQAHHRSLRAQLEGRRRAPSRRTQGGADHGRPKRPRARHHQERHPPSEAARQCPDGRRGVRLLVRQRNEVG
jgi:hypothetical protein